MTKCDKLKKVAKYIEKCHLVCNFVCVFLRNLIKYTCNILLLFLLAKKGRNFFMQNKRLYKFLGATLGILVLLALYCGAIGIYTFRSSTPSAQTQIMTVKKVYLKDRYSTETVYKSTINSLPSDSNTENVYYDAWHETDSEVAISEGDFVVLNTSLHAYTKEDGTVLVEKGREAIAIDFPGTITTRSVPTVTIYHNGSAISHNQAVEAIDDNNNGTGECTFFQYLFALTPTEVETGNLNDCYYTYPSKKDATTSKYVKGDKISAPEGKYTIILKYFDVKEAEKIEEISFYLATEKTYNQPNENPTFSNTEKLGLTINTTGNMKNSEIIKAQMTSTNQYFNFTNALTTSYIASEGAFATTTTTKEFDQLYYPTLIYNPEKFLISYTRVTSSYRETITTSFYSTYQEQRGEITQYGYLTVETTTTKNPGQVIQRVYKIEPNPEGASSLYTIKMQFDKVGKYTFTKTPIIKSNLDGITYTYDKPDNKVITDDETYFANTILTINGFVAQYSDTTTTSAPLYDDTFDYNTMTAEKEDGTLHTTNDVVYSRDFLTAGKNIEISSTTRTRAETIYTADMTFANGLLGNGDLGNGNLGNGNYISKNTMRAYILSYYNNSTPNSLSEDKAFEKFFEYNNAVQGNSDYDGKYIRTSYKKTADGTTTKKCTVRASTNLAPVTFEFYGTLYTGDSADNNNASWYAFCDNSGNVSVKNYTRGMSFSTPGEYIVQIAYKNLAYSSSNQIGSKKYEYMHQIFCFEITNDTPVISVLAQEDTSTPNMLTRQSAEKIETQGYTNKYVYASWETAGPFDAQIECKYSVTDWNDNVIIENASLNGLVYQSNLERGTQTAISTKTDLLYGSAKRLGYYSDYGQDGKYCIQIFRKNNPKAWVNYEFYIDTAPITNIETIKVAGNHVPIDNTTNSYTVLSRTDPQDNKNFNLVVSDAFGFTWDDKLSGAPITALYVYANINKTTNFDLVKAIAGELATQESDAENKLLEMANSGAVYMPTNASLGIFNPALNYTKLNPEDSSTELKASQIINTPQLAFLLLRDAAGNTAIHATMLDNTNTQVLQIEKQSSYVNVITKDTKFYWGTHKSINAEKYTGTREEGSPSVLDVYDLVKENVGYSPATGDQKEHLEWTINNITYTSNSSNFVNNILALDLSVNNSVNIKLSKVQITASDDQDDKIEPKVGETGNAPENWYAVITVNKDTADKIDGECTTSVRIDNSDDNVKTHTLENGEFRYTILVKDSGGNDNSGGLYVEVNLDKSLGSMRSYWDYESNKDDLSYSRKEDSITDQQYVANTYSTNRRYVAFSWTEPQNVSYKINNIKLEFYTFSDNTDSTAYPYESSPSRTVTLYNYSDSDYDYTPNNSANLNIIESDFENKNGEKITYYLTQILLKIPYSVEFGNDGASEAGKYVITREYMGIDGVDINSSEFDFDGDRKIKEYTYYIDRRTVLPTDKKYGDERIQFGYNQGEYSNYPDYPEKGSIIFDNYGLITNKETFGKVSFDYEGGYQDANSPSNVIVKSNILPASVKMSTWEYQTSEETTKYNVYDKYYTNNITVYNADTQEAGLKKLRDLLNTYKNATRLQVVVQTFDYYGPGQYGISNQHFYSTRSTDTVYDSIQKNTLSLTALNNAFSRVGKYRVLLFDLSNFEGLLTGYESSFEQFSYGTDIINLYPNCSVVSFELTGVAPDFDFRASLDSSEYGPLSTKTDKDELLTDYTKAMITWTDSSDEYSAMNAFNDVYILKTTLKKGTRGDDDSAYNRFGYSTSTEDKMLEKPIEITYNEDVAVSLENSGYIRINVNNNLKDSIKANGLRNITINNMNFDDYIQNQIRLYEEKRAQNPDLPEYTSYFLKVEDEQALKDIVNNGIKGTSLEDVEFYKVRKLDSVKLYTYYLLLPKAVVEDEDKNDTKLSDTKFRVTIHYIGEKEDYEKNKDPCYETTKVMYEDYTAPYYNLIDLIDNDPFITSLGAQFKNELIQNIENPDYTFLKSYAFSVNRNFIIKYRNIYESSSTIYYYERTDYAQYPDRQVLIEKDNRYENSPMFDLTNGKFKTLEYNKAIGLTSGNYYDIIEIDKAGNKRVYTIYVTNNNYAISYINNGDNSISTQINSANIDNTVINSGKFSNTNNMGFLITKFENNDAWMYLKLANEMGPKQETRVFYLVPETAYTVVCDVFKSDDIVVCKNIDELIDAINSWISEVAFAHDESQPEADGNHGSHIRFYVFDRMQTDTTSENSSHYFVINTQGKMLIEDQNDFLELVNSDTVNKRFTLRMPDSEEFLSTYLTGLTTKLIIEDRGDPYNITVDINGNSLPKNESDFSNDKLISSGYTFSLVTNYAYRFNFTDNFGRTMFYSYPTDKDLIKNLIFTGPALDYVYNNTNYTFTSNDVKFQYQSNVLDIFVNIEDLNTGNTVYQKSFTEKFDITDETYFVYNGDDLSQNIVTLEFIANRGLNIHVYLEVNNGISTIGKFDFAMYTVLPKITISDVNGSPVTNNLTAKEVVIKYQDVASTTLFNPYVQIILPDGTIQKIDSGFSVKEDGVYIVQCMSDLGEYYRGRVTFTIQPSKISIYGVLWKKASGEYIQLTPFTKNYSYTPVGTTSGQTIAQYLFLSNDSNWDNNIEIILNEDKDLAFSIEKEYGNTRIYQVYGEENSLFQIQVYFAVTRIPYYTLTEQTTFKLDGKIPDSYSDFKTTNDVVNTDGKEGVSLTWGTSYQDKSAQKSGGPTYIYPNFYTLNLYYNGTFVGAYTSGSINLINSGIYTFSITDPVGQKYYFESSSTFELTILTNVIYYVNNGAGIMHATYSDPVDFYVPNLSYYDYTPKVQIYRNNSLLELTPNNDGHYNISTPGSYKIIMKSAIENQIGDNPGSQFEQVYQFVIVTPNEAIQSYDFAPVAGYEIINVTRLDSNLDITDSIRQDGKKLTSIHIDPENLGVGKYQITVRTEAVGYLPSQTYTFSIWINNEQVILTPSRDWGSSSTKNFTVSVNTASVYERIGECHIMINGVIKLTIDESNKDNVDPTTIKPITQQGDYIVQLVSASGTVLQSYRMTILEPLNIAAIVLISIAVIVVIVLTIVFIVMRKKVRVR